jgi:Ca2+/Na+ antiporter
MIMAGNPLDEIVQGFGKIISLSAAAREQQQQEAIGAQILAVAFIVGIIVAIIFFIGTLYKALKNCAKANRVLPPGTAWLLLVPFFNLVWCFVMVIVVAMSLRNELNARRTGAPSLPGIGIGLAACILNAVCVIPSVPVIVGIASIVCWIVYWIVIAGHSRDLETDSHGSTAQGVRIVYRGEQETHRKPDMDEIPASQHTSHISEPVPEPVSDTSDLEHDIFVERLRNLQKLYDDGLISQAEYDQKKRELMNLAF